MTDPTTRVTLTRRSLFTLTFGVAATGLLAGCSTGGGTARTVNKAQSFAAPKYVAPQAVPGGLVSKVPGMPPTYVNPPKTYFTTVPTPPGDGSAVTSFQILWGAPPQPEAKNKYWQQLNKNIGIDFKPTLVSSDNYNDKMATTIASGDVPDLMFVQDSTAVGAGAINDGVFADLSEVLAGDKILKYPNLANIQTSTWKASAKNGHIFGIPNENPYLSNFPVIRQDAMKAAGHDSVPTDGDGFKAMLADMGKLGKVQGKQFWPITGLTGNIFNIAQWMFRAGTTWQLKDGKLVNVIETDEYQASLDYLNQLWKANVFHPDAVSLGTQNEKNSGLFTAGQAGLHVDSVNGFFGAAILTDLQKNTPGADPIFLVPPGHDGGDIVLQRDAGYWGVVGISAKAAKDPKRLALLLQVCNYWRAPYGSKESLFINSGIEGVNYKFDSAGNMIPLGDDTADNDRAGIQWLGCFNSPTTRIPLAANKFVDDYQAKVEKLTAATVPDPTVGLYSKTNTSASAKLGQLATNYQNGIVTGRMPVSDVKKYRDDWRKAGGDQIRKEFQAALDKA